MTTTYPPRQRHLTLVKPAGRIFIPAYDQTLFAMDWWEDGDGARRAVTYLPTGQWATFDTEAEADVFAADVEGAVAFFRSQAEMVRRAGFVLEEEYNRAERALMIFATPPTLLPAGTPVDAVCYCGGYLTLQKGRQWIHVNTCQDELDHPGEACPHDQNNHKVCQTPAAVQCEHIQCRQSNDVNTVPCDLGYLCCGNHHGYGDE